MTFRKSHIFIFAIVVSLLSLLSCSSENQLSSPEAEIRLIFNTADSDSAAGSFTLIHGRDTIMDHSMLGLVGEGLPAGGYKIVRIEHGGNSESWSAPWGENKAHINTYTEMAVVLESGETGLTIRFRAFDDGVAFRYETDATVDTIILTDELTTFNFAHSGGRSWSIPANFETYELKYSVQPIDKVMSANTPFTFETADGLYGSIHEAALYDYPEMTLRRDEEGSPLKADLAPLNDSVKAIIPGKFVTPWRTIQLSRTAVGLINSSLILNLNEPCAIKDTKWIKPQKYVGIWWGMHLGTQTWTMGPRHGATTRNAIDYIDFAAENNIQGVLFEGWNVGWENWGKSQKFDYLKAYPDFDIDSIARYARTKGVELWMHNETGGNLADYEAVVDSAFAYYASLGVHTVKTGYAGGFSNGHYHHSQVGVRHYQMVVEAAARHGIMLDVHEPIKDTGIRRTWPNMMTREGARGMEWNAWSEGNDASYLCTLPFVRLLSGPMDYTPGIFDIDYKRAKADKGRIEWNGPNGDCRIRTTLARQIANWVIIYSPLQMAADQIENYRGHPAFRFFSDYDADIDESKALDGEIGEYIVVVRRAGNKYYLAAATDDKARTLRVPLTFLTQTTLDEQGFDADLYTDHPSRPDSVVIIHKTKVLPADTLTLQLQPSGGAAVVLRRPAPEDGR